MEIREGFFYSESHEWVGPCEDGYRIGITDHAQHALGDIVFVELPEEDEGFDAEDEIGVVESVKAVSDVYVPVPCVVLCVNADLEENPNLINDDPYGAGWLIEVNIEDPSCLEDLMTAEEYDAFLHRRDG